MKPSPFVTYSQLENIRAAAKEHLKFCRQYCKPECPVAKLLSDNPADESVDFTSKEFFTLIEYRMDTLLARYGHSKPPMSEQKCLLEILLWVQQQKPELRLPPSARIVREDLQQYRV